MRLNKSALRFISDTEVAIKQVATAANARHIANEWVRTHLDGDALALTLGLPEVDARYEAWQVALLTKLSGETVGNLRIACQNGEILLATSPSIIISRLHGYSRTSQIVDIPTEQIQPTGHDIYEGDSRYILMKFQSESVGLVITSPPYFNAKPEYSEYTTYQEYLELLRDVFSQCYRLLGEGRFIVVNASPILIRRAKRNQSSKRIPVPFHINTILEELGFDFIDDIIWVKPSGAGWNTGRGRRFAADRHPLQYKPVPVTEYFLVYRKHTDKLIDWNIRKHPDQEAVKASRIEDGYEVTNIWNSSPSHHCKHPATFPKSIIRKLIKYYSFKGEVVLDPFAGIGTVGKSAIAENRNFTLIDINTEYCQIMRDELLNGGDCAD